MTLALRAFALICLVAASPALAQSVTFGGLRANPEAPVEVSADKFEVDNQTGLAVFSGEVVVIQADMRLSAARLDVEYVAGDQSKIKTLRASGGVTMATLQEAAEAREAVYDVGAGTLVLSGDVMLTQGGNVLTGNTLNVNLVTGKGQMDGRVKTILIPKEK